MGPLLLHRRYCGSCAFLGNNCILIGCSHGKLSPFPLSLLAVSCSGSAVGSFIAEPADEFVSSGNSATFCFARGLGLGRGRAMGCCLSAAGTTLDRWTRWSRRPSFLNFCLDSVHAWWLLGLRFRHYGFGLLLRQSVPNLSYARH